MANPFANAGLEQWNAPGAFEGVGQGLMAMGVDASGLGSYLNKIGMSRNDKGGYQFKPPVGAAVPNQPNTISTQVTPILPQPESQYHPEVNDSWSKTGPQIVTPGPISQPSSPTSLNTMGVNPQASRDIPVQQGSVAVAPPEWDQQKGEKGIGDMFKGALMKFIGGSMMS